MEAVIVKTPRHFKEWLRSWSGPEENPESFIPIYGIKDTRGKIFTKCWLSPKMPSNWDEIRDEIEMNIELNKNKNNV